ncbi:MAG: hypothetical protein ACYTHK_05345 [Planctomycetota bacterium]|jgi:hypothetical protein
MRSTFVVLLLCAAVGFAVWRLLPEAPDGQSESFVPAWTGARESTPPGMTILRLAGTPRERGRAHGERLKGRIRDWYEHLSPDELFVRTLGPRAAGALPPALREEIEGIAEGAGLSFEQVWFLNLRFDLAAFERPGFAAAAAAGRGGRVHRRFEQSDLSDRAGELVVFVHLTGQPLVLVGLPGMAGGFLGTRGMRAATLRPVQEAPDPVMTGLAWPVLLRLLLEQGCTELPAPATLDASVPSADVEVGTLDLSPREFTWHAADGEFAVAHAEPLSAEAVLDPTRRRTRAERARRLFVEEPPAHLVAVDLQATRSGVLVTIRRDGVRFHQVIRFAD